MATKGEYLINEETAPPVAGVRRAFGVMFDPASAASRRGIVDSGLRYEIQLTRGGRVRFRAEGLDWAEVVPANSPNGPPVMLSFNEDRDGLPLPGVRFEMIAVGRGRILAKERITGRLFHLVMNDLFKTYPRPSLGAIASAGNRQPPDTAVPGNYFKLDPEFFSTTGSSPSFPAALAESYNRHPASLRFPLFRLLLSAQLLDATVITQCPREWHLIDARSPLSIIGPEDLQITDDDFRAVMDRATIASILRENQGSLNSVAAFIDTWVRAGIDEVLLQTGFSATRNGARTFLENKGLGWLLDFTDKAMSLPAMVARFFLEWLDDNVAVSLRRDLSARVVELLIDALSRVIRSCLRSILDRGCRTPLG